MQKKALVIIDIQNDITKNYKEVIDNINAAIDWAVDQDIHVVYIRHENLSDGTRTFKLNTHGSEIASDLKIVSKNVFTKCRGNALSSAEFADFIHEKSNRRILHRRRRCRRLCENNLFQFAQSKLRRCRPVRLYHQL